MERLRIVVLGTMAADPYAGMAWMHMQIAAGLLRLGHDVHYMETTSAWPYDPLQGVRRRESDYALPYLGRVTARFGLGEAWCYRRSYSDNAWLGPDAARGAALLREADLVLNVAGATSPRTDGLEVGRLVYLGTDPVAPEIRYQAGDPAVRALVDEHADVVTYGENIGTTRSPLPALPRLRARTRQPVLMDQWACGPPAREVFTTVGNWRQEGKDVVWRGRSYRWSKHHEFLRFLDVPRLSGRAIELATNLGTPRADHDEARQAFDPNEIHAAERVDLRDRRVLHEKGWLVADGPSFSTDPWRYRDYIVASRAEFTVARELNVATRSGWFSERSACYLAAGRPVVTQDTGFGDVLPTGSGLFAFATTEEAVEAIRAIDTDYARHSEAARAIAREWFSAEVVLPKLLGDLGF